jgi:hypothetical protein
MLIVVGDKNFCGRQFEADLEALDATIHRPRRKDEKGRGPHQLRVRLAARFTALAAAIALNHRLGRPSRSLACYTV